MAFREFSKNDIFVNTVSTSPRIEFKMSDGKLFYKKNFASTVPDGHLGLFDLNVQPQVVSLCGDQLDFSLADACNTGHLSHII